MLSDCYVEFIEMLKIATQMVERNYFKLPVDSADPVYRERVYCYELYHQLRCRWDDFPFKLCGEIDKSSHPRFKNGPYPNSKPDLLVHKPGFMKNLAVIEVKSCDTTGSYKKDLEKLIYFCKNANYHHGIFLVYGTRREYVEKKVLRAVRSFNQDEIQRFIEVFHHVDAGQPASQILTE